MTMRDHVCSAQTSLRPLSADWASSLRSRIADWLATAVDYYTAAALYEQLSRLSDAELQRRGLWRATLASDVCQACERAKL